MIWKAKQLEKALSVKLPMGSASIYGKVKFNSDHIDKGDLFIALNGARDGHEFVADALARGASAAIISKDVDPSIDSSKLIKVDNCLEALQELAEYKRKNSKAKFIAVTGSVGKTSTKEAIKMMLEPYGKTCASYGTFNNFLGVPLTLASIADDAKYVVVEMGMNAKGELSEFSKQVIPDIAVITTVSEGHIEFFDSIEDIADAKCEIFEGLDINDGIAIINRDISTYERCMENIDNVGLQNVISFGKRLDANIRLVLYEAMEDSSTRLKYNVLGEEIEIAMHSMPLHLCENFAAAFAVISTLKLDVELAASAITAYQTVLGRGHVVSIAKGGKSYQVICDYYNSNPQSLRASLLNLTQCLSADKIAILGDMGELGKHSAALHEAMISPIKDTGISKLFLIGDAMMPLAKACPESIYVQCYKTADEMIADIDQQITGGELILIKGSRSMQLEKIAKALGVKNVL